MMNIRASLFKLKERKKKTNALNALAELMREQNIALHDLGLKHRRIILQLLLDNSWNFTEQKPMIKQWKNGDRQ
jgi:hypothetical protein